MICTSIMCDLMASVVLLHTVFKTFEKCYKRLCSKKFSKDIYNSEILLYTVDMIN